MATNDDSRLPCYRYGVGRFKEPYDKVATIRINEQWFRNLGRNLRSFFIATWLDWLFLMIIGATEAAVWVSPHAFTRYIPVTAPGGVIFWPELAYPHVEPIFSSVAAGVLSATIPISVFLIAQLWLHSFQDFASALLGLTYAMVTGTCFQVILKKTIGGFRPHFLAVCKPVIPPHEGAGYGNIMYTAEQICTGDPWQVQNALESFPSGHAEVAFAGLGYLAIYLFTHLRITSRCDRSKASYWKMLLIIAPLFFATYLSSTLVLGYHHHWHDVVFGALVGSLMAMFGYRMVFQGVVDSEWNTVPCLRLVEVGEDQSGSPLQRV